MLDFLAILIYCGGVAFTYTFQRRSGEGIVSASIDAAAWPIELGITVAYWRVLAAANAKEELDDE